MNTGGEMAQRKPRVNSGLSCTGIGHLATRPPLPWPPLPSSAAKAEPARTLALVLVLVLLEALPLPMTLPPLSSTSTLPMRLSFFLS